MIKDALSKLLKNPLRYSKHIFVKVFITPFKYKIKDDYNARQYWEDRFKKHGDSLVSVGDEGMDAQGNRLMYEEAGSIFRKTIHSLNVDLSQARILEIGTGTGFFTRIIHESGARHYTGVDITDTFFEKLRKNFPGFNFIQKDITCDDIPGAFDLIVIIDVIEHIVNEEKLTNALNRLQHSLNKGGYCLISPIMSKTKRLQFHFQTWDEGRITRFMPDLAVRERIPFRGNTLLLLERPK